MIADFPIITVDGPSGVGKGTVCGHLSQRLGFALLDSGSLYRLTGFAARTHSVDLSDATGCAMIAASLDVRFEHDDGLQVWLAGENVTDQIRTEQAGQDASVVAAIPAVRDALLDWQRHSVTSPGLIADGRDMGTVVFPNAGLKIFLDASTEERARRRHLQLIDAGQNVTLAAVFSEMQERDDRDRNRSTAPLQAAKDAKVLDTSSMGLQMMLQTIDDWVDRHLQDLG